MGQINVIPQVYKNNFVKAVLDSNGNVDHLTCTAGDIDSSIGAAKIYPLGGQPYPWETDKFPVGSTCRVDCSNYLSGLGKTKVPLEFVNDGEVLRPNGEQILYSKFGSYASPAALITTVSGENNFFTNDNLLKIPYQFMYLEMGIRIRFLGYKPDADTGGTTFRLRLGTSTQANNNNVMLQPTTASAANSEMSFDTTIRITALGDTSQAKCTYPGMSKLFTSATTTADSAGDKTTGFSTSAYNYIAINAIPANAGSQAALVNFAISIVP
ncbi:MAG: hypothetical protein JSR71_09090 [Proteobacteria bacterium]|nr:hypothetical protein [Pseudomonadota bacterium]